MEDGAFEATPRTTPCNKVHKKTTGQRRTEPLVAESSSLVASRIAMLPIHTQYHQRVAEEADHPFLLEPRPFRISRMREQIIAFNKATVKQRSTKLPHHYFSQVQEESRVILALGQQVPFGDLFVKLYKNEIIWVFLGHHGIKKVTGLATNESQSCRSPFSTEQDNPIRFIPPTSRWHAKRASSDQQSHEGNHRSSTEDGSNVRGDKTQQKWKLPGNESPIKEDERISRSSVRHDQWMCRYRELLQYRAEKGNCSVPVGYKGHAGLLATWTKRQRYQYKCKMKGKHSHLIQERQDLLEKVGFNWDNHAAAWEHNFDNIVLFLRQHGHCRVSTTNKQLFAWCKRQKTQHRLWISGEGSTLTEGRIRRLSDVGFVWKTLSPHGDTSAVVETGGVEATKNEARDRAVKHTKHASK